MPRRDVSGEVGYKLVRGGGVPGGHNVLWDGTREPFITPMRECNSIPLRHSDVVADIGAYVGTYAIRCARFPVKEVTAYEPTPRTYAVLSLTSLPNMRAVQAAVVGGDRRSADLFISRGLGVTNSTVLSRSKAHRIAVPAIRYEDAVAGASIVKIDVEGAEYEYPIVQPQLRAVIIDFHPVPGDWVGAARRIMRGLLDAGFEAVIEPEFSCGWTRAGSWIRPGETAGECGPLMRGEACCGCGRAIRAGGRALCRACFQAWSARHCAGYMCGGETADG